MKEGDNRERGHKELVQRKGWIMQEEKEENRERRDREKAEGNRSQN